MRPDFSHEASFWQKGASFVLGLDEAGRGCLAGPVSAAVALWPKDTCLENIPSGLRDSKQISESGREKIFTEMLPLLSAYGMGLASAEEVDQHNILRATHLAFARAMVAFLAMFKAQNKNFTLRDFALIADGNRPLLSPAKYFLGLPAYQAELAPLAEFIALGWPEEIAVVKGDGKVASVAAASILAKVNRDRLMLSLDQKYPSYQFAAHKGYGTATHVELLRKHGPCAEHRRTFAPVRALSNPEFSF